MLFWNGNSILAGKFQFGVWVYSILIVSYVPVWTTVSTILSFSTT